MTMITSFKSLTLDADNLPSPCYYRQSKRTGEYTIYIPNPELELKDEFSVKVAKFLQDGFDRNLEDDADGTFSAVVDEFRADFFIDGSVVFYSLKDDTRPVFGMFFSKAGYHLLESENGSPKLQQLLAPEGTLSKLSMEIWKNFKFSDFAIEYERNLIESDMIR